MIWSFTADMNHVPNNMVKLNVKLVAPISFRRMWIRKPWHQIWPNEDIWSSPRKRRHDFFYSFSYSYDLNLLDKLSKDANSFSIYYPLLLALLCLSNNYYLISSIKLKDFPLNISAELLVLVWWIENFQVVILTTGSSRLTSLSAT